MTHKKAMTLAMQAVEDLKNVPFNDPVKDTVFDLYTFTMNEKKLNVFAYIGKQRDEEYGTEWYSVYAGVEYVGGDTLYADYAHSTNGLLVEELADEIFALGNMYTREENREELWKMMQEDIAESKEEFLDVTAANIDWEVDDEEEYGGVDLPSEVTIFDEFHARDYKNKDNTFDMTSLTEDVVSYLCDRYGFLIRNLYIRVSNPCISVHVSDS